MNFTILVLPLALVACDREDKPTGAIVNPTPVDPSSETPVRLDTVASPDPTEPSDAGDRLDIDLVFAPGHLFSASQVELVRKAAAQWEAIIQSGLKESDFTVIPFRTDEHDWGDARMGSVVIDSLVDDLVVLVTTSPDTISREGETWAYGGPFIWRAADSMPIISQLVVAETALTETMEKDGTLWTILMHEFAHTIGFGTAWTEAVLKDADGDDPYFGGPRAVEAFNEAGGSDYSGPKVPVAAYDGAHWRGSAFGNELMSTLGGGQYAPISLVTIQSFADLGYTVDVSHADEYSVLKTAGAKPAGATWRCRVR